MLKCHLGWLRKASLGKCCLERESEKERVHWTEGGTSAFQARDKGQWWKECCRVYKGKEGANHSQPQATRRHQCFSPGRGCDCPKRFLRLRPTENLGGRCHRSGQDLQHITVAFLRPSDSTCPGFCHRCCSCGNSLVVFLPLNLGRGLNSRVGDLVRQRREYREGEHRCKSEG